jgi:LuxR family transcriptional regulator, maltose regulon positive regulatory protein
MFLIDSTRDLALAHLELITDKITPPQWQPRLSRPRLLQIIEKSLAAGTSTIVSGRAGTGKSSLVVDFARQCKRRIAWYKIDAPDHDPVVFFNYFIGSIRCCRPEFGSAFLSSLTQIADAQYMTWFADGFVHELEEENAEPLLIVIEDLHLVSDADWVVPFFSRLLPLLPSNVHLLITSRNLPTPPLWRMRSKQSLVLIDEATLAFTRHEAIALFETYGLSSEHAFIALDHTHGRASALDDSAMLLLRTNENSPVLQSST